MKTIKLLRLPLGIAFALLILTGCTSVSSGDSNNHTLPRIPSLSEIQENGYPRNENGETYGPDLKNNVDSNPDLVLAENDEGIVGYIHESEIAGSSIRTPNEAANYTSHDHYINMYLDDGTTVIGQFLIDG